MRNVFAYMRISTKEERNKQKFSRQEKSIEKWEESNNIECLMKFKDDCSGKDFDRPEWQRLMKIIQDGDTIIFKDISRFTRNAEQGFKIFSELRNRNINLIFIDNPTVSTDYINKLSSTAAEQDLVTRVALESIIKLLLIVELDRVQKEREIFIQRVKDGIDASPKTSGRKPNTMEKLSEELKIDIIKLINDRSIKYVTVMKKHNISRNTLKKYIKNVEAELKLNKEAESKAKSEYMEGQVDVDDLVVEAIVEPLAKVTNSTAHNGAVDESTNTSESNVGKDNLCKSSIEEKVKEDKEQPKSTKDDERIESLKDFCLRKYSPKDTKTITNVRNWLSSKECQTVKDYWNCKDDELANLLLELEINVKANNKLIKRFYLNCNGNLDYFTF